MKANAQQWTVRLAAAAEADFQHIVRWTIEKFGDKQAIVYAETLATAIAALAEGPTPAGTRARDEILKGLFSFHVARKGRKGRHFIIFRIGSSGIIEVLRILHDSMDLQRHFDADDE